MPSERYQNPDAGTPECNTNGNTRSGRIAPRALTTKGPALLVCPRGLSMADVARRLLRGQVGAMVLAYSDEPSAASKSVTFMSEVIGVSGIATVGLLGVVASFLNLQKTTKVGVARSRRESLLSAIRLHGPRADAPRAVTASAAGVARGAIPVAGVLPRW